MDYAAGGLYNAPSKATYFTQLNYIRTYKINALLIDLRFLLLYF